MERLIEMSLLEVRNLVTNYGAIKAVKGISFKVEEGEIVTLVGSNGAGKSTTLNTIAGLVPATSGEIWLNGINITSVDPSIRVLNGLTLAPEGRQVFPDLTTEGNLRMGAYTLKSETQKQSGFDLAYQLFPILKERRHQLAGTLSGGEQQMLAIARALMARPKLLMLDEPSLGLAPLIVRTIFDLIKRINIEGTTILLVEQNARMALSISNRGCVLETGKIVLEGTKDNLLNNPEIQDAYLGGRIKTYKENSDG